MNCGFPQAIHREPAFIASGDLAVNKIRLGYNGVTNLILSNDAFKWRDMHL